MKDLGMRRITLLGGGLIAGGKVVPATTGGCIFAAVVVTVAGGAMVTIAGGAFVTCCCVLTAAAASGVLVGAVLVFATMGGCCPLTAAASALIGTLVTVDGAAAFGLAVGAVVTTPGRVFGVALTLLVACPAVFVIAGGGVMLVTDVVTVVGVVFCGLLCAGNGGAPLIGGSELGATCGPITIPPGGVVVVGALPVAPKMASTN